MPLFEAVTIEVGAAIAKSILKLWLKDSMLGGDISSSIIDVLKSRTSDVLAQRRGQRQFDVIGEKIGENLLPLFESEGARLDEGSRTAVAYEVAAAFNKSKLSAELIAKRNLEPTELAKHVLASHSIAAQPFSDIEKAFYQRIIEESCAYIVDIASQLPAFTERTLAEVLKRENQLIDKTDQILQEVHRIRQQLNPMTDAGRFEEDYRKAVARKLDELQLFGTDVSTANRRHRLSVAYITLSVEHKFPPFSERGSTDTVAAKVPEDSQDETSRDIVSVDEALARSRCLLIRGLAGSGKTTLLQWIAVRSASRTFEGHLLKWNNILPFFVRLRQCIQTGLPSPEAFPGLVAPAIAGTMPKGWVNVQLKSGRAVVLIDGLDEVPTIQREDVRTWLKELVETYPQAGFIITSRPHAIEEGWINREVFSDAELQPMQLSDIYTFIDHWHKAVQEELPDNEEKTELESLAEHLKKDVRYNPSLRNLATNPLLCAMLCALNRERRQQLPANRIELYEACCSLLLERRDKERRIELTDYPALNYSQKRRLLEDLAYWMIKNNWSEVTMQLVNERFDRKLKNMPGIAQDISGHGVCRLFVERAGIVREPVAERIDFTHRTFQEFLAAKAALDEMDIGVLVVNAHNDLWREVIILASGLAAQLTCEKLITGLIARGDTSKKYRYQLHLLAVSCLETSVELGTEVKTEVEKRLSKIVPPQKIQDAKSLAPAGDLAVKYLVNSGKLSAYSAAACVRTLILIGSDAALEVLEGYANDTRSVVINELFRGWDSFDRETYARRVLSQTLRNRADLRLERLPSLEGIQYFKNLTSLSLSGYDQVSALSSLAGLTELTSLDLSYCNQITDFSPLSGLTQLRELNLSGCSRLETFSLSGLTQLRELNLSGCFRLETFSLSGLTQLRELNLSGCSRLDTLSLSDLTSLELLNLFYCSQLGTLSLTNLTQLERLDLSDCSQINALSLTGLTQLRELNLSSCAYLKSLKLKDLTQLRGLNLSSCIHLITLNLTSLTKLASLNLLRCFQLNTLNLTDLAQLMWLDLSRCSQLKTLSLKDLTQLTSLNLSGCTQIHDLSALIGLSGLEELVLSGEILNKVTIPQSIKKKVVVI